MTLRRGRLVRALLASLVALFAFTVPQGAMAAGLEKLSASQVSYRTEAIALVRGPNGRYQQEPVADAALGRDDRVRYMIVATNQSKDPAVAGVAIQIPEFTEFVPQTTNDEFDIIEATTDGRSWSAAPLKHPKNKARILGIRWVLADVLGPQMSAAFVFELHLTGPYSDRTGDLNATRKPDSKPVEALTTEQVQKIRDEHADQAKPAPLAAFDPIFAGLSEKGALIDFNGMKAFEVGRRLDVVYGVAGTALIKNADGTYSSTPLDAAKLQVGDKVTYSLLARNVGSEPRPAGAVLTIPAFARYEGVKNAYGFIVEVSTDGQTWFPDAVTNPKLARDKVRFVRWATIENVAVKATASFSVQMQIVEQPLQNMAHSQPQNAFSAMSPSMVQTLRFTSAVLGSTKTSYHGVPFSEHLAALVSKPAPPGIVRGNATPVPTPAPPQAAAPVKAAKPPSNDILLGIAGAGVLLFALVFLLSRLLSRSTSGNNPRVRAPGRALSGSIKRGRIASDEEHRTNV